MMSAMVEADRAAEWPRLLRPLVRRGWLPRRYRRDDESSYLLLILVMLGPLGSVLSCSRHPSG